METSLCFSRLKSGLLPTASTASLWNLRISSGMNPLEALFRARDTKMKDSLMSSTEGICVPHAVPLSVTVSHV